MSVELLQTLSLVAYVISGVLLVLTIVLFFWFKIPQVVGDISGATARKAIEDIRRQNEETGNKTYKSSAVNQARGRLTDKISSSGRLIRNTGRMDAGMGTQKINTDILKADAQRSLQNTQETTMLTQELVQETTLLTQNLAQETTLLTPEMSHLEKQQSTFTVETELGFCESSELIE